jgi:hypothetical protein
LKFIYGEENKEIIKFAKYKSLPEEMNGIWFNFAMIENDEVYKIICSAYKNDKFPTGSIVVTNKIYNDFPIAHSGWLHSGQISRMYVDPFYRNKKIAKYSVIANDMISEYLNLECWSFIFHELGGTKAGDQLYNSIYNLNFPVEKVKIDLEDIYQYRNYSYPIIYFDKRAVYDENLI